MFSANSTQVSDESGYKAYWTGTAANNVTTSGYTGASVNALPRLFASPIVYTSYASANGYTNQVGCIAFIDDQGRLFTAGFLNGGVTNGCFEIKVPGKTFVRCAVAPAAGGLNNTYQSGAAITSDGNLYTWGQNDSGQLGIGTQSNVYNNYSPVQVGADGEWDYTDEAPVVGGYGNFYAKKAAGTWWGWGYNGYGILGQNNQISYSSPVQIGGSWKMIRPSNYFAVFGIKADGSLWFWGYSQGGLGGGGVGTPYQVSSPTQIGALTTWNEVSPNPYWVFATKTDGTLWMWGDLGPTSGETTGTFKRSSPVQFGALTTWTKPVRGQSVNGNLYNQYAIKTDGTLWAWGIGNYNSFYNATNYESNEGQSLSPVQVSGISNAVQVAYFNGFINSDPQYWYLGGLIQTSNNDGKDAYIVGSTKSANNVMLTFPRFIKSFNSMAVTPRFESAAVTSTAFAGTKSDGSLWASGSPGYAFGNTYPPVQVGTDKNWGQTVAGGDYATFHNIKTDGTLWAWGSNAYGVIGNGTTTNVLSSAVQIGALTTWTKIDGSSFRVATKSDGTMWVWGLNLSYGYLGLPDKTNRSSPTQLGALTNWTTNFAAGYDYTLALKSDNSLWGWGRNTYGAWGIAAANRSSPVQIAASSAYDKFTAGYEISLFRKPNGTLWVSGNGTTYGLGNGTYSSTTSPIQIGTGTDWDTPFTNFQTCFCTKTDGSLWGWGRNDYGQLGLGNQSGVNSPVQISTGVADSDNSFSTNLVGSPVYSNTLLNSK